MIRISEKYKPDPIDFRSGLPEFQDFRDVYRLNYPIKSVKTLCA